mgnify:CR=1 FL=1
MTDLDIEHATGLRRLAEREAMGVNASEPMPSIRDSIQALRDAGGDGWDSIDDPETFLYGERRMTTNTPETLSVACPHFVYPVESCERCMRARFIGKTMANLSRPDQPDRGEKYRKPFPGGGRHDVYDVLVAFGVTCPAVAHAVKKLLCAGQRGHKDRLTDLREAMTALARAAELERSGS